MRVGLSVRVGLVQFCVAAAVLMGGFAHNVGSAHAFELFGRCLIGKCESKHDPSSGLIDPINYSIDLHIEDRDDNSLVSAIENASGLWRGRSSPVGGSAGLIARAKADYRRILAALYNEGHYGVSISIQLNGQEVSRLKPGANVADNAQVKVFVDPGAALVTVIFPKE